MWAFEAGVKVQTFASGTVWGDFNDDRFIDLFIAGYPRSYLFKNNGNGTFTDVAESSGVSAPESPFAAWFWDYNNDGVLDLYVTSTSGPVGVLALTAVADEVDEDELGKIRLERAVRNSVAGSFKTAYEMPSLFEETAKVVSAMSRLSEV